MKKRMNGSITVHKSASGGSIKRITMIKPNGSMRSTTADAPGRQQSREHTTAVERWNRKEVKNHQQYIEIYARLTDSHDPIGF